MDKVVVLSETGALQLTSLSRHALYHAITVLLPNQSMTAVLPQSGSRKVEDFCSELPKCISSKLRKRQTNLVSSSEGNPLVKSLEIHKFLEHVITVESFTESLEAQLLEMSGGEIDSEKLHEICWGVYQSEKSQEVSIRHWFSPTCTYRMWLVFCCVQEQHLSDTLSDVTTNEVIRRLGELCGYTWNEAYRYSETPQLTFPQYLRAIANHFTQLKLEMSLTCEVIGDMVDEIVHGVLKKGFLTKKGHKRKNWKRRWFVLQRTILRYFENRDSSNLKGFLMLNSKTDVKSIPDRGKKKCLFEVTCGHTGTPFEIFADDQKMKHEWMLAIRKAIALAKVLDGSSKQDDFTEHLSGFYLLKYGTSQPELARQDSTVRNMKYYATFKDQRKRLSGKKKTGEQTIPDPALSDSGEFSSSTATTPSQEDYLPMNPLEPNGIAYSDESSDDENYTKMTPIKESLDSSHSRSLELLSTPDFTTKTSDHSTTKDLHDDSTDSNDDVYDEAAPLSLPRYTPRPRALDKELGGYIPVHQINDRRTSNSTISNNSNKDINIQYTEASKKLSVDSGEGIDQGSSSYLTIIRGEDSPGEDSTRRAKTMEPVVYKPPAKPPIPTHSSSITLGSGRGEAPPPVLPRPKGSPSPTVRNKHMSTSSIDTKNQYRDPPPLPPH